VTALRWFLAWAHLLGLGIGLGAVWVRALALRGRLDPEGIRRVLAADAWWGIAALLWISTGLWRLFAGTEKATDYYLSNHVFWAKMVLFVGILAMEVRPIVTFARWRRALAAGTAPDTSTAPRLARVSRVQAITVALMVLAATAMARGIGGR
jgi:putative membrane protein